VSSSWAILDPLGYRENNGLSAEQATRLVADRRFLFSIFGFIALGLLAILRMGTRVLQTRAAPEKLASGGLRGLHLLLGLASVGLIAFGIWNIPSAGLVSRHLLLVVAGAFGPLKWTPLSRQKKSDPSLHPVRPSWP